MSWAHALVSPGSPSRPRIIDGLRPPALTELGLVGAIDEFCRLMSVSPSPTISRETPESLPDLAPAVEVAAYRVTSEAVTNAVRHADAARILVTLATTAEGISVSVTDDGSGWDASPDVTHAGLSTMRERTEEIGGRLSIQSGRAGTSVHA